MQKVIIRGLVYPHDKQDCAKNFGKTCPNSPGDRCWLDGGIWNSNNVPAGRDTEFRQLIGKPI
jgi:hypothetical protein